MKRLLILILPLFLVGCATLDIATQDTAIPLKKGKVEAQYYTGNAIDLASAVIIKERDDTNDDIESMRPLGSVVQGVKLSFGLKDNHEIGLKAWTGLASWGGKIYLKNLIKENNNTFTAIIPGIVLVTGEIESNNDDNNGHDWTYKALGAELQILGTKRFGKFASSTLALRINSSAYTEEHKWGYEQAEIFGPYLITHFGARANFRLQVLPFYLIPELGIEVIPVVNGDLKAIGTISAGVGLQF